MKEVFSPLKKNLNILFLTISLTIQGNSWGSSSHPLKILSEGGSIGSRLDKFPNGKLGKGRIGSKPVRNNLKSNEEDTKKLKFAILPGNPVRFETLFSPFPIESTTKGADKSRTIKREKRDFVILKYEKILEFCQVWQSLKCSRGFSLVTKSLIFTIWFHFKPGWWFQRLFLKNLFFENSILFITRGRLTTYWRIEVQVYLVRPIQGRRTRGAQGRT